MNWEKYIMTFYTYPSYMLHFHCLFIYIYFLMLLIFHYFPFDYFNLSKCKEKEKKNNFLTVLNTCFPPYILIAMLSYSYTNEVPIRPFRILI